MCGYSGFINFDKQNSEQDNIQNLKKMLNEIKFRGPDDSGIWKPKEYTGTFGSNDTYLDFKLDQRFVQKLLFSNALCYDSGLHQDCKVFIYKEDNFKITKTYLND